VALLALGALSACATAPTRVGTRLDWSAISDVPVIEIVTTDEDGDARRTSVWFVLVDGVSYLRTNDSRWLANIRRDPRVKIAIDGTEYPQRAEEVTDAELVERIEAASQEKYGFQNSFIRFFRSGEPQVLKLSDPSGDAAAARPAESCSRAGPR
jgi:hypothetical protein